MLVLFALIGITFVLVASQSRRAMRSESRSDQQQVDVPNKLLEEVFEEVVRDTTNNRSALRGHSLLADIYGLGGVKGQLTTPVTPQGGGQFIDLVIDTANFSVLGTYKTGMAPTFVNTPFPSATQMQQPGYFNGCVYTATSGTAAGVSTRIVGSSFNGTNLTLRVVANETLIATNLAPQDEFVINGRPFNGSGSGFNVGSGQLDLTYPAPTAVPLSPSITGPLSITFMPNVNWTEYAKGPDGIANNGDDLPRPLISPNEDYDAADHQTYALAYIPLTPAHTIPLPTPAGSTLQRDVILPSFHRPDLINHWASRLPMGSQTWNQIDLRILRQIMSRPIGRGVTNSDHPQFTGSNPSFHPITGPWDVDNDGDGVPDSIWIDVGLPAQTTPDGRRFKPLVAILCQDLDGRLNVNAQGSIAHTQTLSYTGAFAGSAMPSSPPLSPGAGYGPADVNLLSIFPTATQYTTLLRGQGNLVGRYGLTAGTSMPGLDNTDDPLSSLKQFELPRGTTRTSYMTPPDLWGRGVVGLDYRGQPLRYGMGPTSYPTDNVDDPYETNLSHNALRGMSPATGADAPFTPGELERVIRRFDYDAVALPSRLATILDPASAIAHHRLVTSESYDLPVPSFRPTREMLLGPDSSPGTGDEFQHTSRAGIPATNLTIMDLLKHRLTQGGVTPTDTVTLNNISRQLLSPELMAGLRIDLNRPLGNGRDDNNNGVIDDIEEALVTGMAAEKLTQDGNAPTAYATTPFRHNPWELDLNGDSSVDEKDNAFDRQLLCRHLYVLAMLLKDSSYNLKNAMGTDDPVLTARTVAQWVVNIVDFRDADSIMTPFEYVVDPFKSAGWNVDNNPATDEGASVRGLVWGCERPELLITETFAFHDRRTEDTDREASGAKVGMGMPMETDFDQELVPRSGLFVELYNPWTGTEQLPGEFYYDTSTMTPSWSNGVLLNKQTPAAAGTQAPVWRMVVVTGSRKQNDLHDPDPANRPVAADVERSIYFTSTSPAAITSDQNQYYTSLSVKPILPGYYAVIGPAEGSSQPAGNNVHHIVIGRKTGDTNAMPYDPATPGGTRRIDLDPTVAITANGVITYGNTGAEEPAANSAKPTVAIVINQPTGKTFSVSEPTAGYSASGAITSTPGQDAVFAPVLDVPVDTAPELKVTGTTQNYKTLHLQRLANPLRPWNPEVGETGHIAGQEVNPYITIDTMPIDLTAFNGVTNDNDPDDPNDGTGENSVMFATRQRGEQNDASGAANLWLREPFAKPDVPSPQMAGSHYFAQQLQHTLGFLNTPLGPAYTGMSAPAGYLGDPQNKPFPWLTWNNRPYATPGELLMVPISRPTRLTQDYGKMADAVGATKDPYTDLFGPYSHLPNFFHSNANIGASPQLHRILDYVRVPAPHVGSEMFLSPTNFGVLPTFPLMGAPSALAGFHAPFNKVYSYREPGRININTIPGDFASTTNPIWWALVNPPSATFPPPTLPPAASLSQWTFIDASRRGPNGSPVSFAMPFRSSGGAVDQVPGLGPYPDVEVSLMRSSRPNNLQTPLFKQNYVGTYSIDTDRNPYFRYQLEQKLSNLVTTRSNVFATWITVGYFEVINHPAGIDTAHPDGLQLGQELGADSGSVKRHRGFWIYDRSIPVAFEPGEDHNISNGVLVRRYIE